MKQKTTEKALILIVVILLTAGVGYYFFVHPNLTAIEEIENETTLTKENIAQANNDLAEIAVLNSKIAPTYNRAIAAQKQFYSEHTPTEYDKIVNGIISSFGKKSASGIKITEIKNTTLFYEPYEFSDNVNYGLRQYAYLQTGTVSEEEGEAAETSKTDETVETTETENNDLEINTIEEAMEYLRDINNINADERETVKQIARDLLTGLKQEIGVVEANFKLTMTTEELNQFLVFITTLERATSVGKVALSTTADERIINDFDITLYLYVLRDMEKAILPYNEMFGEVQ